jgi:hypothetical protein
VGEPSGTGVADDADAVLDGLVRLGVELPFNRHLGVEVREVTVGTVVNRSEVDLVYLRPETDVG